MQTQKMPGTPSGPGTFRQFQFPDKLICMRSQHPAFGRCHDVRELPRQVGKASWADIPRLVEIRAAVRENILSDPSWVTTADIQWFIDNSTIWTWAEDGQIHGFSAGDPRDGTIFALFVDPDREGRGIGQALLALACATRQ